MPLKTKIRYAGGLLWTQAEHDQLRKVMLAGRGVDAAAKEAWAHQEYDLRTGLQAGDEVADRNEQ